MSFSGGKVESVVILGGEKVHFRLQALIVINMFVPEVD